MKNSRNQQRGFSLVEMLVALALGALMMAGIASSFSAITQAQQLTRDYEQVQETLRFTTSLISRSLRTAEKLVDKPADNAPTDNNQFSVLRQGRHDRRSCNGQTPLPEEVLFYETYYLNDSNQLVCEVTRESGGPQDWEGSEVIAYGIESFSLECLEYSDTDELTESDYVACDGATHAEVIALKITLEFDTGEFMRLESYPDHTFTATLRSRLRGCAQHGTQINPVCEE